MLLRTDPFRDLERFTDTVFGTPARPAAMPLDAHRSGDSFVVEVDLPGVSADSIDITVEHEVLSIRATRTRPKDSAHTVVAERPFGTFERRVILADSLDTDRIEASYLDGVLTLRLPVADRAKPRRVPVTSGSDQPSPVAAGSPAGAAPGAAAAGAGGSVDAGSHSVGSEHLVSA